MTKFDYSAYKLNMSDVDIFSANYLTLLIFAALGLAQLLWGIKLMYKYNGDPLKWTGFGGPIHFNLIIGGIAFLLGSLVVLLLKILA